MAESSQERKKSYLIQFNYDNKTFSIETDLYIQILNINQMHIIVHIGISVGIR